MGIPYNSIPAVGGTFTLTCAVNLRKIKQNDNIDQMTFKKTIEFHFPVYVDKNNFLHLAL